MNQHGGIKLLLVVFVLFFCVFAIFQSIDSHALSSNGKLFSGFGGMCLDVYHDKDQPGTPVQLYSCNGTGAQTWQLQDVAVVHNGDYCLSVDGDSKQPGSAIVLNRCDSAPGQVWLRDRTGFINPNSDLCLYVPTSASGTKLQLASCGLLASPNATVTPAGGTVTGGYLGRCDSRNEGQRVACVAEQQWVAWQTDGQNHSKLLNAYTDGSPYEEWCADFVSYVYKNAGYPFTKGEADGWDESDANNIQNMGFSYHDIDGYTPQVGDVGYFDYSGGHVEIVISGGPTPTFLYGNSATTDPTTGNGQMATNTITDDGAAGQIQFYLSPKSE